VNGGMEASGGKSGFRQHYMVLILFVKTFEFSSSDLIRKKKYDHVNKKSKTTKAKKYESFMLQNNTP
jgi:hypothetical protein